LMREVSFQNGLRFFGITSLSVSPSKLSELVSSAMVVSNNSPPDPARICDLERRE